MFNCICVCIIPTLVYISEKGSDVDGDGSEAKPFKTLLQAMRSAGKEPFPVMYTDGKDDDKVYVNKKCVFYLSHYCIHGWHLCITLFIKKWEEVSQSQVKKNKKLWEKEQRVKREKAAKEVCMHIHISNGLNPLCCNCYYLNISVE